MALPLDRRPSSPLVESLRDLVLRPQPAWVGYACAFGIVTVAFGLKFLQWPFGSADEVPYITFFLAVVLSSWFGWRAGAFATMLSAGLAAYFFVSPDNSFAVGTGRMAHLAVFVAEGLAISALGGIARQAFDQRGSIVEAERRARRRADRLTERLSILQGLTANLASASSQQDVGRVVIEQAMPAVGANIAALVILDKGAGRFQTVAAVGLPEDVIARGVEFSSEIKTPFADACRTGAPVMLTSREDRHRQYPNLAEEPGNSGEALVVLPLMLEEEVIGALGFSLTTARQFSDEELSLLAVFAGQCAVALERARLIEEQRLAHLALDREYVELEALFDLLEGAVHAETIGEIYEQTMRAIKRALKTDRAAVLLYGEGDVMSFVAWEGLSDRYRAAVNGHSPWERGDPNPKPVLVPDALADESLAALRDVIRAEGVRALAFIPLVYKETLIGKCMLYYDTTHAFTERELQTAIIIANKTALAIQRKRAEDALAQSEVRFRSLFERNYDAVFSFDLDGRFTSVNSKVEQVTGYTREELIGMRFENLVARERLEETFQTFLRVVQGEQEMLETTIRHKDGHPIEVSVTGMPIVVRDTIEGVFGIARDVTDERQAEQLLRESEERFASFMAHLPAATWIKDAAGRYVFANSEAARIFNTPIEHLYGKTDYDVFPAETAREFAENDESVLMSGESLRTTEDLLQADGLEHHSLVAKFPISLDESGPRYVGGIAVDVTAQQEAERAVRESERQYRELVEGLGVALYTTDAHGVITHYNEAAVELWGRRPEIGKDKWCGSLKLYWADGRPMEHDECPMALTLRENRPALGYEAIAERPDGTRVPFIPYPTLLHNESGELVGAVNVLVDISDRKRAEQELQTTLQALSASQQRTDHLMGNVPGVVWEAWGQPDLANQRIDFVSDHVETMLGYTVEEWLNTPNFWLTIVHPEDKERAAAEAAAIFASGKGGQSQFRWIAKDGRVVWVDAHSSVIVDAEGNPLGMRGVTIDVTERKRAEQYLGLVTSNVPALISYVDRDQTYVYANKTYLDWFGEDPVGRHMADVLGEAAYRELLPQVERALAGETVTFETLAPYKSGGSRHIHATYVPDKQPGGSIPGFVVMVNDVTERKRAEERFTAAFQASPAAISITRARDRVLLDVNEAFCEVIGYAHEELVGRRVEDIGLWATAEDQQRFAAGLAEQGRVRNMETRIRDKHGQIRHTWGSAEIISVDGEECVLALFYDITERKRFETSLRDSEARTTAILNTAVDGIIAIDEQGMIESLNPAVGRLFGYDEDELPGLVGRNVSVLMPEPYRGGHDSYLANYFATGDRKIIGIGREVEGMRKDGSTFPMDLSVSEVQLEGRRIFTGIVHDLTERKRAEDRLKFLVGATERLSKSLDYITVLREMAAIAVPALADWCAVDVIGEENEIKRLVVTHSDPTKGEIARLLEQRHIRNTQEIPGVIEQLQRGEAMLNPDLTEADLVATATDETHLEIMQELGFKSAMIIPIRTRDRLIGAVTLVASAESGRRYSEDDLSFAQELCRRAAIAVENARLFTESQAIQQQLRLVNEQKDEFLGMVSHELRTPVTIIYGAATVLRARGATFDEASRDELLADIDRESHRLRRLVEDMLVLARMELQHANDSREPVNMERTIERVLRELLQRHPNQKTQVSVEGHLPPVAAEPTYLEQVLRNLITNALKYAPNGPIEVRAHRNGGNEAVVSVLDRGPGLRSDELQQVFDRFYRADRTSTIGGTGMGLTVCKRLIEAQSGRIWAEQREGGGLSVSFSLPFYSESN